MPLARTSASTGGPRSEALAIPSALAPGSSQATSADSAAERAARQSPATRRLPGRWSAASSRSAGPSASRACRSACARPTICRVGTGSHSRAGAPPRVRRPGRPSPGPARAAPRPARGAPRPGRPPRPGRAAPAAPRRACRSSWSANRPSWEASGRPQAPPTRRHAPAPVPARIRAAALARAVGRLREAGRPLGHLPVVVSLGRASPRLAALGRRRACRRGSRVAADPEACATDGHGDPPVGRGASAPFCRDGTILAHGRSPWGPDPEISSTPSVRVISSRNRGCTPKSGTINLVTTQSKELRNYGEGTPRP